MQTSVEVLEGNKAKITVTIEKPVVVDRFKRQYKKFANQYNFPGFRKGKAPRPVIDNMLGKEAAAAAVTDELVNETCPLAIDESGLYPVGQVRFDDDMALMKDGAEFTYVFEIDTKPTPELSSYDPVEIELPPEGANDAEIDAEIDALREHYYEVVDAADDAEIVADGFAQLAITATDDSGEEIATLKTEDVQYGLGAGLYPPTFDEQLIGLKKGDKKQFTIDTPTEVYARTASMMGKTAQINFDIEVLSVRERQLPELTDEWVKEKIGMDDIAALRAEIADEIVDSKGSYLPRLKEGRALNALAERLLGELPEGLVQENETGLLQDFFSQLQRQGLTLDAYIKQQGITSAQFRDDIKMQAEDLTRQDLALDAYAAHAGMEATDEEIRAEFEKTGSPDVDGLMDDWKRNGQMYMVRQGILRQKAAAEVVEQAKVTEMALPSTDEEPAAEAEPEEAAEEKAPKHAAKKAAKHAAEPAAEEAEEAQEQPGEPTEE